jgi:heterotetrameric sarcosine oxidase gamma subunit
MRASEAMPMSEDEMPELAPELKWTDTLSAPRSLATRSDTAVAIIEDPGVIEIALEMRDSYLQRRVGKIAGVKLSTDPWSVNEKKGVRAVWVGPWRWRLFFPRERTAELLAAFREDIETSVLSDLTGGFACFRVIGGAAEDILVRCCPVDLSGVNAGTARGISLAGVKCLLLREAEIAQSFLVFAPRSLAEHVARALTEAARTPGRLALFEPAKPPPV